MADDPLKCSVCDEPLISKRWTYVGKLQLAYHVWCYVTKLAPSVRAGAMVN